MLCAVLLIYSFQFRPAFLPHLSARQHSGMLGLPNIGRCQKILGGFCMKRTGQGNDLDLIPTAKMELDIPHRNHLVFNFQRFVIIAELWRPEVARR